MSDELLGKYIAGEATADEQAAVRRWLLESPDHPAELARLERIWVAAGKRSGPESAPAFDTDRAWQRLHGQMHRQATPVESPAQVPTRRGQPGWLRVARVAAVALLIGTVAFLTYQSYQNPDAIDPTTTLLTQSTTNRTQRLTLPDGSTVLLNRQSSLRYPATFDGDTREVTLTGEAFFDVKPNANQPFIIHAQDTDVRVVGTSFGVRAYNRNVEVSVKTGRVVVRKKRQEVAVTPGQQVQVDSTADTLRRLPTFDANTLAYSTRRLQFTNQPLSGVVGTLSRYYGTDIQLSATQLRDCRLTAEFENESVETVLGIVAETLQLTVKSTGNGYVLSGTGCGPSAQ
ncbi:DUF4974 domain-containing protein [Rudanella paleaurantiibacter]|uniref:DUF4974 domain-containing protein n=1 Tax=Rudanella paleaurantiibacter TaxID=2614655 RepID=A0A7J5U5A4_9BACT|nr:FecR domain-containing protein [Rudanella paleaurantiibacter]KAB7733029.1 DUF4974 domain-containing protein [Rudanella paleaurantiibacter]